MDKDRCIALRAIRVDGAPEVDKTPRVVGYVLIGPSIEMVLLYLTAMVFSNLVNKVIHFSYNTSETKHLSKHNDFTYIWFDAVLRNIVYAYFIRFRIIIKTFFTTSVRMSNSAIFRTLATRISMSPYWIVCFSFGQY